MEPIAAARKCTRMPVQASAHACRNASNAPHCTTTVRLSTRQSLAAATRKPDSQGATNKNGRSTRTSLALPAT
eukprot:3754810-Alexandrium_andersonii.AAC.1